MKTITTLLALMALTGCMTSGVYTKEPVFNPDGTVARNMLGMVVYSKVKESQHVAIASKATQAFAGRRSLPEASCSYLSGDQIVLLGEAMAAYFESVAECERSRGTAKLVAAALGRPNSASGEIVQGYADIVASVESGRTARFRSGITAIASLGTSAIIGSAVKAGFDATRDVGVAAAENAGNIEVGSLTVDNSQSVSNSSNDASGIEGSGTSTITSTLTNNSETTIALGRGNRAFVTNTSDSARALIEPSASQVVEPSSIGVITSDSTTNRSQAAEELIDENNEDVLQ